MMTEKTCFAELLKAEIMERYGLREDQVRLQLDISTTDLELGRQILSDFGDKSSWKNFLAEGKNSDFVYGNKIETVNIFRKDGFYGEFIYSDDEA